MPIPSPAPDIVIFSLENVWYWGHIEHLAKLGCIARCRSALTTGQRFPLHLRLTPWRLSVTVHGAVRWMDSTSVGFEFIGMSAPDRRRLEYSIATRPVPTDLK
jgi:hypothetical protein